MIFKIVFIIIGFLLLMKGADFLVDGASNIAKKFNIPTIIIGLTIVAIGTSMPELMVSTASAMHGLPDMSIGNVVGSNIVNLFLILGICAIIKPLKFKQETESCDNLIAIFASCILMFFGNNGKTNIITRSEGIIFVSFCIVFILYNIYRMKKQKFSENFELDIEIKEISTVKSILDIVVGIFALKIGGDTVVKYSAEVAQIFGLSQKIISITIIAFSTSLPELITSITATLKGDTDMAIGNILGSQIFNILLIIGISAIICPIKYSEVFNIDMMFLIIGTILFTIFPLIGKRHYMTKKNGILFLIIYIAYIVYNVDKVI